MHCKKRGERQEGIRGIRGERQVGIRGFNRRRDMIAGIPDHHEGGAHGGHC
jgi:hypothetical protein